MAMLLLRVVLLFRNDGENYGSTSSSLVVFFINLLPHSLTAAACRSVGMFVA